MVQIGHETGALNTEARAPRPATAPNLNGSSTLPKGPAVSMASIDGDLGGQLDRYSIEDIVEFKIARFFDQLGSYYPENLHELIMNKVEKPLLSQMLKRVGGNQVHASRILGINRNTLRKKMKLYGL